MSWGLATTKAATAPAARARSAGCVLRAPGAAAGQPGQQRGGGQQQGHDRRFLVDQHAGAQDRAEDHALAAAGAAAQPDRGLQGHGQEQRPEGDVEVVPVLPGEHGGQAEQGAGGDGAGRLEPEPGGAVHDVAQQPGQDDGQQGERGAGAEGQGDGGHDQPGQRHGGVEAELDADRRGHVAGEPGVAQVHDLVRGPPQIPHVTRDVPGLRQQVPGQVGGPGPGNRDPGGQVDDQQRQVPQHRVRDRLGRGPGRHTGPGKGGAGAVGDGRLVTGPRRVSWPDGGRVPRLQHAGLARAGGLQPPGPATACRVHALTCPASVQSSCRADSRRDDGYGMTQSQLGRDPGKG
jgi:hypothetical protein